MPNDPTTTQDALRGASDGLLLAIREVDARERLKRSLHPGDDGFEALAREVRIAAEAVLFLAREEEARARETSGTSLGAGLPTIEASMPRADLADILGQWRAVERRLGEADPSTPEAQRLMEEFATLRDRYAAALKALKGGA